MLRLKILLSVSVLILTTPAQAEEPTEEARTAAEEHSRLGVEHYAARRYPDAIREMLLAYQAVPDPGLLYNVARIYQAMDETALAIDYLQRYVAEPGADPETVQKALQHLTDLREAAPDAAQARLPIEEMEPTLPGESELTHPAKLPTSTPAGGGFRGSHLLLGSGLATIATGGVFGWKAVQSQRQYADPTLGMDARLSAAELGQRQALVADLTLLGGALLLSGGAWLSYRGGVLELSIGSGGAFVLSGPQ